MSLKKKLPLNYFIPFPPSLAAASENSPGETGHAKDKDQNLITD
jgi:hypothetical protein